jgi:1-deoxy-D-xylulose-5-phosphate reductoisomerase
MIATIAEVDIVMSAIVGSKGLLPTYAAIKANKKVLLANKESLVTGGKLINAALASGTAQLIPVDSEHSAIFQALPYDYQQNTTAMASVNKIILTASGGPFLKFTHEELTKVTPEMAIKHPNWLMGKKISVDSSTLMNKGLEVIEAYWLFGSALDKIEVVVHPQSIIHSMVEYIDGSIIAQLGAPDMKTPIAYALAYPQRITSGSEKLDFAKLCNLTFEEPDYARFPCLKLAFNALKSGGVAPAVLNAANEVAVAAFLANQIGFYDINALIQNSLDHFGDREFMTIDEIIDIDSQTREYTQKLICNNLFIE